MDFQIERLKSQETIGSIPFVDDFRAVERLFPGISIKRLEEIEAFHRQLIGILADEVAEEITLAEKELASTNESIEQLVTALTSETELGSRSCKTQLQQTAARRQRMPELRRIA